MSAIYFIAAWQQGLVKIGCSRDPDARLDRLSRMSPVPLHLVAAIKIETTTQRREMMAIERRLHERHFDARHHGEWFHITPELRADMRDAALGVLNLSALPEITHRTWSGNGRTQPIASAA